MMRFTILGCGSSGGVPRFGGIDGAGDWGDCDPTNPKNARRRCALLVEKIEGNAMTRLCIDAGPDFRAQMLSAKTADLDALVLSHEHADHIHGIDDIRQIVNLRSHNEILARQAAGEEITKADYFDIVERNRVDCYAGLTCHNRILSQFTYLFEAEPGTIYPPIMRLHRIEDEFSIEGEAGTISLTPFAVPHGALDAYGFAIDGLVYLPDVFDLTEDARALICNCDVLIIDCLQFRPHGTHANYEKTMGWIEELKPKRAILTNLHSAIDYDVLNEMTPAHVSPAYDGLQIIR